MREKVFAYRSWGSHFLRRLKITEEQHELILYNLTPALLVFMLECKRLEVDVRTLIKDFNDIFVKNIKSHFFPKEKLNILKQFIIREHNYEGSSREVKMLIQILREIKLSLSSDNSRAIKFEMTGEIFHALCCLNSDLTLRLMRPHKWGVKAFKMNEISRFSFYFHQIDGRIKHLGCVASPVLRLSFYKQMMLGALSHPMIGRIDELYGRYSLLLHQYANKIFSPISDLASVVELAGTILREKPASLYIISNAMQKNRNMRHELLIPLLRAGNTIILTALSIERVEESLQKYIFQIKSPHNNPRAINALTEQLERDGVRVVFDGVFFDAFYPGGVDEREPVIECYHARCEMGDAAVNGTSLRSLNTLASHAFNAQKLSGLMEALTLRLHQGRKVYQYPSDPCAVPGSRQLCFTSGGPALCMTPFVYANLPCKEPQVVLRVGVLVSAVSWNKHFSFILKQTFETFPNAVFHVLAYGLEEPHHLNRLADELDPQGFFTNIQLSRCTTKRAYGLWAYSQDVVILPYGAASIPATRILECGTPVISQCSEAHSQTTFPWRIMQACFPSSIASMFTYKGVDAFQYGVHIISTLFKIVRKKDRVELHNKIHAHQLTNPFSNIMSNPKIALELLLSSMHRGGLLDEKTAEPTAPLKQCCLTVPEETQRIGLFFCDRLQAPYLDSTNRQSIVAHIVSYSAHS